MNLITLLITPGPKTELRQLELIHVKVLYYLHIISNDI